MPRLALGVSLHAAECFAARPAARTFPLTLGKLSSTITRRCTVCVRARCSAKSHASRLNLQTKRARTRITTRLRSRSGTVAICGSDARCTGEVRDCGLTDEDGRCLVIVGRWINAHWLKTCASGHIFTGLFPNMFHPQKSHSHSAAVPRHGLVKEEKASASMRCTACRTL